VVFATPPGRSRRSTSPSAPRPGGSGIACTRRSSSSTGAALSITCPVGASAPSVIALRQRRSTGSRPSSTASLSIWASWANAACTEPKPRIAPHGGLLV
jgi:hypothetical protein